jgi:hypothetical protein
VRIKDSISKVSLIIYAVMLMLSGFVPAMSGGLAVWFLITGIFAIPLILSDTKRYRIIGIIALLIALAAAIADYQEGRYWQSIIREYKKLNEPRAVPDKAVQREHSKEIYGIGCKHFES